jgi:hypothetical protein
MPRSCSVCSHPESFEINEALVLEGRSKRSIADHYGLSPSAVQRHREHIPQLLVEASHAQEVADTDALLDEVRALRDRTLAILDKAEEAEELRTALSAIAQARGNLELFAKLLGELNEQPVLNLEVHPAWIELKALILTALEDYPEARWAVLRAIKGSATNGRP